MAERALLTHLIKGAHVDELRVHAVEERAERDAVGEGGVKVIHGDVGVAVQLSLAPTEHPALERALALGPGVSWHVPHGRGRRCQHVLGPGEWAWDRQEMVDPPLPPSSAVSSSPSSPSLTPILKVWIKRHTMPRMLLVLPSTISARERGRSAHQRSSPRRDKGDRT